jgi:aspartyl-tRNA(Asn)/glutamyl-tRNA(Gln) amidotransferase subunit C
VSSLTAADVRRIATLARLELNEHEIERLTVELAAILDYAAQVQRVDTSDAEAQPSGHDTSEPDRRPLRPDALAPSLPRTTVLEDAAGGDPATGFFTVPRVLGA